MKIKILLLAFTLYIIYLPAQNNNYISTAWAIKKPFEHNAFIENKGQLTLEEKNNDGRNILYYSRKGKLQLYFSTNGITFCYDSLIQLQQDEKYEKEEEKRNIKVIPVCLRMNWEGANPDAKIEVENEVSDYFTYNDPKDKSGHSGIMANAWQKLIYHNLYKGIDIEFYYPEEKGGMEYRILANPGADLSLIKMSYSNNARTSIVDNNLSVSCPGINILDHAPTAKSENGDTVPVSFSIHNNLVTFKTGIYNTAESLIIDPWITSTNFTGFNSAYDIDYDNLGNVYIGGGEPPYLFQKYNSNGVLLWTYTFPVTGPPYWWGAFTTDIRNGTSYICEGLDGQNDDLLVKVNTLGMQTAMASTLSLAYEMWRIRFDYCNNQLVIGAGESQQVNLMDTNLNNFTSVFPLGALVSVGYQHDMALLALDNHGIAYVATNCPNLDSNLNNFNNVMLRLHLPLLSPTDYIVNDGYKFSELTSLTYYPYTYNGGGLNYANGFNGMAASKNTLVTYDGSVLKKWQPTSGILRKYIPVSDTSFKWGGLDLDCQDNIYAGNNNTINVYDSNLSLLYSIPLEGTAYALKVDNNGHLYACGKGFVESIINNNMDDLITISSTSPSSCNATDGTATAIIACGAGTYSYLWSNGQTTQTITGLGIGSYTVTVSDSGSCLPKERVQVVSLGSGASVFVPDAFSPNGDGYNDQLYIKYACVIKTMDFVIFDRWGNKVFESEDISKGWDGTYKNKAMNTGTYVYYLEATLSDGENIKKTGNVTLVR